MSNKQYPVIEKFLTDSNKLRCTNILADGKQCSNPADTLHHPFWPKPEHKESTEVEMRLKRGPKKGKKQVVTVVAYKKLSKWWREKTGWINRGQVKIPLCSDCHLKKLNPIFSKCYDLMKRRKLHNCDYDKGNACFQCFRHYEKYPEDAPHLLQIIQKPPIKPAPRPKGRPAPP